MNIYQAKELLALLDRKDGQAEEMQKFTKLGIELNGLRFDLPFERLFYKQFDGVCGDGWPGDHSDSIYLHNVIEYLIERLRRAESLHIPDLKEKVKAMCLACMDAARDSVELPMSEESEFRALCAPEVKP